MDKNAIKKYAVWARRELIERVSQRAMIYGITAKDAGDPNAESVNGHLLSQAERRQRQALIRNIKSKGYEQVIEEVAYTWFNRFAALRFMEVNGYLPSHIRVFTNDAGEFKPQILAEAIHLELDGLDMNKVYELESANKSEELFKYLLIVQCNALNSILPRMFQKLDDYTVLLLPDYLLREGSVIEQMVTTIPEVDWTDQVQIIGWLYQYYNTEPKDKVFADLKKNIKITKDRIPAATQLFTPDWIVHYMVENSLGRLWLEGHPNDTLKSEWKYYLDEAEQEADVEAQLTKIREEYTTLKPQEIRVIDPCMGSGHILCVLFDVLVRIYEDYGYTAREAAVKIVENNLWGLDIDERAAQLSYFAVMMKARQYDRRFFNRKVQPHVYAIEESNGITTALMHEMGLNLSQEEYATAVKQAMLLVEEMHDAKEYGSIIHVTPSDWDLLRRFAIPRGVEGQIRLDIHGEVEASARLQGLINIGQAMAQKYHAVVTNPPYLSSGGMSTKLTEYLKVKYPSVKSDLSTVFMAKTMEMCCSNGFMGMINIPVWMFIQAYKKLREVVVEKKCIVNMVHNGRGVFGSDFGTTAFIIRESKTIGYKGAYLRLFDNANNVDSVDQKEQWFYERKGICNACQDDFAIIPSYPIAYWLSNAMFSAFKDYKPLKEFVTPASGTSTGDNNTFLRMWPEVSLDKVGLNLSKEYDGYGYKWIPCNKGGAYRRWYGNFDYVMDWENNGYGIRNNKDERGKLRSRPLNLDKNFLPGLTWTKVGAGAFSLRYFPSGFICESIGAALYEKKGDLIPILGFLNTKIADAVMAVINPTMGCQPGDLALIPTYIPHEYENQIRELAYKCIEISKKDWDSFENSWEFQRHPLIRNQSTIKSSFNAWEKECARRLTYLKQYEEELNRIFICAYHLENELSPEIDAKMLTVRKANLQREVRSFISYAVGCMFGRYSLDYAGLAYAGGTWDMSKYSRFIPDQDAIIPICDDEYFNDDIVGRFEEFVKIVYGEDTLEENLQFIADALGAKGTPRDTIRSYFINDFFKDHCVQYSGTVGKRPIYWLFDSGKKNGFKCLVYIHRYQPDTIARIRTDYIHEQQSRYRTAMVDLEQRISNAAASERVKLNKELAKLRAQAEETRVYEEKIHHLADQMIKIDLDDGVKHNYEIFKDVLAKIK